MIDIWAARNDKDICQSEKPVLGKLLGSPNLQKLIKIVLESVSVFLYNKIKNRKKYLFFCRDILKEYLESREKIGLAVEMCQELGLSFQETVIRIAKKFQLSPSISEDRVEEYWK